MSNSKKGFTLIELLVVIALIGILYRSVSWVKNEVIEDSTSVYKIIGFSTLLHFSNNVVIWASVLTKEKW